MASGSGPETSMSTTATPSDRAVFAARSMVTGTGRASTRQARIESSPVKARNARRPSAVCSITTDISASLSEVSPSTVCPSRVAVAMTGTSSRASQSATMARK